MAVVVTPMSGRGDRNARWAHDEGASPREDEHERRGARIVRLLWSKDKAGIPRMLVRGVPRRGGVRGAAPSAGQSSDHQSGRDVG